MEKENRNGSHNLAIAVCALRSFVYSFFIFFFFLSSFHFGSIHATVAVKYEYGYWPISPSSSLTDSILSFVCVLGVPQRSGVLFLNKFTSISCPTHAHAPTEKKTYKYIDRASRLSPMEYTLNIIYTDILIAVFIGCWPRSPSSSRYSLYNTKAHP